MRGIVFLFLMFFSVGQAMGAESPLELTADQTLEWHKNEKMFIASGNVVVTQGDAVIRAQSLRADYRESEESSFDIYRLSAEGDVTIAAQGSAAAGDRAVYDVKSGVATMTGKDLRMSAPGQTVTARDRFEYDVNQGRLSAYGAVVVTRSADTLSADTVGVVFAPGADGQRRLQKLEANGNVVVKTANETLSGRKAVYDAASDVATVTGAVKIVRGSNVLEGDSADANLTTGVSRIKGAAAPASLTGAAPGGRVRGVFYPETMDEKPLPP